MERAKALIEVTAGVVPGTPEQEFTRQWAVTEGEWAKARASDDSNAEINLLAERNGQAQGYAGMLMLQPAVLNWVRVDWIWL
jgi:hypothetical protein